LLPRSGFYALTHSVMSSAVFGRTEQMHQSFTFTVSDRGEASVTLSPGMLAGIVVGILLFFCIGVIICVVVRRRRSRARDSSESDAPPQTIEFVSGTVDDSMILGTTETMTSDGSALTMPLISPVFSATPPTGSWI
jgi:hypothetical protein